MELDLNKPVRFKKDKSECWLTKMPVKFSNCVAVIYKENAGILSPLLAGVFPLSDLENIPEPVKHTKYVRLCQFGDNTYLDVCDELDSLNEDTWTRVIVWRDEEGKTKVEVAD